MVFILLSEEGKHFFSQAIFNNYVSIIQCILSSFFFCDWWWKFEEFVLWYTSLFLWLFLLNIFMNVQRYTWYVSTSWRYKYIYTYDTCEYTLIYIEIIIKKITITTKIQPNLHQIYSKMSPIFKFIAMTLSQFNTFGISFFNPSTFKFQ